MTELDLRFRLLYRDSSLLWPFLTAFGGHGIRKSLESTVDAYVEGQKPRSLSAGIHVAGRQKKGES